MGNETNTEANTETNTDSNHYSTGKIALKTSLGYAIGGFPDFIPYNLFYIYFLYFFTDIVGLSPAWGGLICLIVILWDAVTDPIVGYLSDNATFKGGRRRPFMKFAIVPLVVVTILLFTSFNFSPTGSFVYYLVMGILLWTFFTLYDIPYYSLGAELTDDFTERNNLRILVGVPIFVAGWFETAFPMYVWDAVTKSGKDQFLWMNADQFSWFLSVALLGILAIACGAYCLRATKGKELVDTAPERVQRQTGGARVFFRNYLELWKNRPVKWIVLFTALSSLTFAVQAGAFVFLMSNNLELSEAMQGNFWTIYSIVALAQLPICRWVANKWGKKACMIVFCIVGIAGSLFYYFYGVPDFTHLIIYNVFFSFFNSAFWTIGYSLIYDCCEIDELISGKRREGAIQGLSSFALKLGSAGGAQLSGILLAVVGYNGLAEMQTADALHGILTLNTLVPAIAIAIGVFMLVMYPINKTNFNKTLKVIELRSEGKEYDLNGLERLLPKQFDPSTVDPNYKGQ